MSWINNLWLFLHDSFPFLFFFMWHWKNYHLRMTVFPNKIKIHVSDIICIYNKYWTLYGYTISVYLNTSGKIFLINNLNINILYVLLMLGNTCTIKWYQNLHYIFHSALKTSFKVVHYFLQSNILSQGLQMSKIHVINRGDKYCTK